MPTARLASETVALPVASSMTAPTAVPSALNVTIPVGMPPLPDTWTVKVTGERTTEGFTLEVKVLVVVAI